MVKGVKGSQHSKLQENSDQDIKIPEWWNRPETIGKSAGSIHAAREICSGQFIPVRRE